MNEFESKKYAVKAFQKMMHILSKTVFFVMMLVVIPIPVWARDWTIEVIALDGIDASADAAIPMQEAINFIQDHAPLLLTFNVISSGAAHNYTYWPCRGDNGAQSGKCVTLGAANVDRTLIRSLPNTSSYLFLYHLNGNKPLQAGSTYGPSSSGLSLNGVRKPVASIPVDVWWYKNQPYQGFKSHEAQIMTHEIINCINTVLTQSPYNCAPLTADSPTSPASSYEASRLAKLTGACYQSYIMN